MPLIVAGLPFATLILYIGIGWLSVKKYRQSRNVGFLILGGGVLLWPAIGNLLRIAADKFAPFSMYGTVSRGELISLGVYSYQIVHAGLILAGLTIISRSVSVISDPDRI